MPKRTKAIIPPAPTAPGGEVKPMPHADSPSVLADSAEFRAETPKALAADQGRCSTCGWVRLYEKCHVCGTFKEFK